VRRFIPVEEWQDPRHQRGMAGERVALAFLTSCGWQVEAHRFRLGRHDVDLIVTRAPVVAFVEVKTRASDAFGSPLEAVNWEKRRSIARVAEVWRLRHGRPADEYRFDLVTVMRGSGGVVVDHVEDAWRLR
jgi:putative endonuclease